MVEERQIARLKKKIECVSDELKFREERLKIQKMSGKLLISIFYLPLFSIFLNID